MSYREPADTAGLITIIAAVLIVVVWAWVTIRENREWAVFAKQHQCRVVAETKSRTLWGNSSDGKLVSTSVPATKTYRCNDGVDYTR